MSIVIVDSPLAGFCHPPAGAWRGEGKFIAKYWKCGFGRSFGCSPRSYTAPRLPKISLQFLTLRSFCIAGKRRRLSVGKSIGSRFRYSRLSRLYRIPVRFAGKDESGPRLSAAPSATQTLGLIGGNACRGRGARAHGRSRALAVTPPTLRDRGRQARGTPRPPTAMPIPALRTPPSGACCSHRQACVHVLSAQPGLARSWSSASLTCGA